MGAFGPPNSDCSPAPMALLKPRNMPLRPGRRTSPSASRAGAREAHLGTVAVQELGMVSVGDHCVEPPDVSELRLRA